MGEPTIPASAVAWATSPAGFAYRGKAGCRNIECTRDGSPDRCYGWHCGWCDSPSNCQGDCSNPDCPGELEVTRV
jgi:hypothetical protein